MKLKDCINDIPVKTIIGNQDVEILNLSLNSNEVGDGTCFFAVRGQKVDGHSYVAAAIQQGAVAVVCEKVPSTLEKNVTYVVVEHTGYALGLVSNAFFNYPSRKLTLVGVTGTNGKTTVTTLLYNFFELLGYKTGLIGTIGNRVHTKQFPTGHTTPDAISLNKLLSLMVKKGCTHAFMEVSSHAIDQGRVAGLHFAGGIFTNLTRDHLDYHKTMEQYFKVKKSFFEKLPKESFALFNADDLYVKDFLKNLSVKTYTYSMKKKADFTAKVKRVSLNGTTLQVNGKETSSHLVGLFNAYNTLATYGAAVLLGITDATVRKTIPRLPAVEGRMELFKGDVLGVVDFAHTPDAVKKLLRDIHELKNTGQKVVCVIGCGGDRDKGKRGDMANIAFHHADIIILTSDNPRSEDPLSILDEMRQGIKVKKSNKIYIIPDRKKAIQAGVVLAYPGGVVTVLGKGHEKYQEINGVKHPFSDQKILAAAIKNLKR